LDKPQGRKPRHVSRWSEKATRLWRFEAARSGRRSRIGRWRRGRGQCGVPGPRVGTECGMFAGTKTARHRARGKAFPYRSLTMNSRYRRLRSWSTCLLRRCSNRLASREGLHDDHRGTAVPADEGGLQCRGVAPDICTVGAGVRNLDLAEATVPSSSRERARLTVRLPLDNSP
jgi:hypothetical protein